MMSQRHTLRAENRALQERQRALKAERTLGDQAVKILLIRHGETEWNATHRSVSVELLFFCNADFSSTSIISSLLPISHDVGQLRSVNKK